MSTSVFPLPVTPCSRNGSPGAPPASAAIASACAALGVCCTRAAAAREANGSRASSSSVTSANPRATSPLSTDGENFRCSSRCDTPARPPTFSSSS